MRPLRQICSWCKAEGVLTVIQDGDEPTSHGICSAHATELHAEAFEKYLGAHPHEVAHRTGETK